MPVLPCNRSQTCFQSGCHLASPLSSQDAAPRFSLPPIVTRIMVMISVVSNLRGDIFVDDLNISKLIANCRAWIWMTSRKIVGVELTSSLSPSFQVWHTLLTMTPTFVPDLSCKLMFDITTLYIGYPSCDRLCPRSTFGCVLCGRLRRRLTLRCPSSGPTPPHVNLGYPSLGATQDRMSATLKYACFAGR